MLLVKFITDDHGDIVEDGVWHYVQDWSDANRTLCGGEVFGEGESPAKYITKRQKSFGKNCEACKKIIKELKAVKL